MYKIIYTTAEDFVKQEIEEHGHDYVEAQFVLGYEPTLDKGGFYVWAESKKERYNDVRLLRSIQTRDAACNISGRNLPYNRTMVSTR